MQIEDYKNEIKVGCIELFSLEVWSIQKKVVPLQRFRAHSPLAG